jgi:hypothetical protein
MTKHVKTEASGPKVPPWATSHFKNAVGAMETLGQLIHISEKGISMVRAAPAIVKVLAKVEASSEDPKSKKQIVLAEKEAALAQTEVESDFPVLHGLAVVALWSGLEHFIKGLLTLWLTHRKEASTAPVVQRLKVKLGDYLQLSKAEQARYLVELIEQDLASSLRRGVSRFESLLESFSLGGSLPDGCAKTLFELQQFRNLVAHRNGIADRQFRSECPWLKVKVNQPVQITREMLIHYFNAAMEYMLTVFYRIGDAYGHDLRPEDASTSLSEGALNASAADSVGAATRPAQNAKAVIKPR